MKNGIPERMRALVLTAPAAFEIREIPVPRPGRDEVLCRIGAVAICGSDTRIIRGDSAGTWPPSYPFTPGHEWAGEIVAVGENVTDYRPGDRVAGEAHNGCGFCGSCQRGLYNLCESYGRPETGHRHYGHLSTGAFAQYAVFARRAVSPIPPQVTFPEGAMVDTAGIALHGLELSGVTPGGSVCIIGPGPVGLMVLKLARSLGAAKAVVVGRGSRLEAARRFGADHLVDFERQDPLQTLKALTGGRGVDEAFECSGAAGSFSQAVQMVRRGGRVCLFGIPPAGTEEKIPFRRIVMDEIGIFGSRANPNVSARVISLIGSGRLVVKDLITHTFPLEEFGRAFDTFTGRKEGALKVVVEPNR